MAQRVPLPITNAMLARANANEAKPRYIVPAEVASDWHGGDFGHDVDIAEATQAIANSCSIRVETDYDPQHQEAKSKDVTPNLVILHDLGKDYGPYNTSPYRAGTIEPRMPYPSVKP